MPKIAKTVLAFTPLLLAYGYIAWLSLTGGHFFLHTQWDVYYNSYFYFAEAEDAKYMPTERARKFTEWYGTQRKDYFNKIRNGEDGFFKVDMDSYSPVARRARVGDSLMYTGAFQNAMNHFMKKKDISGLDTRGRAIFGKELAAGLWRRHMGEMVLGWGENFIGGLGYYKDVFELQLFKHASFIINFVALVLSGIAIIYCPAARWPLVLMAGIHLMAILAASMGHFVIARYVRPTAAFLLLAGMCSLWILGSLGYTRMKQSAP